MDLVARVSITIGFGGLYICEKMSTFVAKLKKQSYETTRVQKVDGVSL